MLLRSTGSRTRSGHRLLASLVLFVGACDRSDSAASPPPRDSVLGLLAGVDAALRQGSEPALADLMVDLADLRKRCPSVAAEDFASVEASRAEHPLSACIGLTDWSALQRGAPQFPLSSGLNVDTKVCAKAWSGCEGVTRMCKSEIFYFEPDAPKHGFKVNLSGVVRIDGQYALLRPPHCMAKDNSL